VALENTYLYYLKGIKFRGFRGFWTKLVPAKKSKSPSSAREIKFPFSLLKKIFICQDKPIDSESDYEDDDGMYLLF